MHIMNGAVSYLRLTIDTGSATLNWSGACLALCACKKKFRFTLACIRDHTVVSVHAILALHITQLAVFVHHAALTPTLCPSQESLANTQALPDVAPGQAVARPYLLASYNEDDILGVIDGDSFLA